MTHSARRKEGQVARTEPALFAIFIDENGFTRDEVDRFILSVVPWKLPAVQSQTTTDEVRSRLLAKFLLREIGAPVKIHSWGMGSGCELDILRSHHNGRAERGICLGTGTRRRCRCNDG